MRLLGTLPYVADIYRQRAKSSSRLSSRVVLVFSLYPKFGEKAVITNCSDVRLRPALYLADTGMESPSW